MFHEQLSAEGRRWRDLTPAEARERVGKIAADLAPDYRDGLLRADDQSRFTARVLAESLQDFVETLVTWMRGQYEFDPAVAELEFGFGAGRRAGLGIGSGRRPSSWRCADGLTGLICAAKPRTARGAW